MVSNYSKSLIILGMLFIQGLSFAQNVETTKLVSDYTDWKKRLAASNNVSLNCEIPKSEFISFVSTFDSTDCYSEFESEKAERISNIDRIKQDVNTCFCLYDKTAAGKSLLPNVSKNRGSIAHNKANLLLKKISAESSSQADIDNRKAATAANITNSAEATAKFAIHGSILGIGENYLNNKTSTGNCISGREYLAFKSLPQDDLIYKEFDNKDFYPDEWNYNLLRKRYDQIMSLSGTEKGPHKEEILKLKSKLIYLDSNPLTKLIFSATENSANEENTKAYKDDQSKLIEVMSGSHLNKKKSELYKILRNFADVKKGCYGKAGECLKQAARNGNMARLNSNLKEFLTQREVAMILKFEQDSNKVPSKNKNRSPENWTYNSVISYFHRDKPDLASPSSCRKTKFINQHACAEIYAEYCPVAEFALEQMSNHDLDDDLKDDVDARVRNSFNLDKLDKNEEFEKLNWAICHTPRKIHKSDGAGVTFFEFKEMHCKANPNASECISNDGSEFQKIREKYIEKYSLPMDPEVLAFNEVSKQVPLKNLDTNEVENKIKSFANNIHDLFDFSHFREANGMRPEKMKSESSFVSGLANLNSTLNQGLSENSNESVSNYLNNYVSNPSEAPVAEVPKIENLNSDQRSQILDSWKEELANYKKEQPSNDNSELNKLREATLNDKIATLEALLAQQQKLTEAQYKLLNDAIAAQTNKPNVGLQKLSEAQNNHEPVRKPQPSAFADNSYSEGSFRSPASVKEFQNELSKTSSEAGRASLGSRSPGALSSDGGASSASSVERENAKLVSLRHNSNGSITIESKGNTQLSPNAITVSISDDLYKMAQLNPTDLNLNQIEKSIPKDQIAQLEKKEYIILLLQNGKNPPLEVKVKKENNRLVQLKNSKVVPRQLYSLESLNNAFK